MASARARIATAVLLACLLAGPTDGWRRRRRRRGPPPCPAHTDALPGAINSWDQTFTFMCPGGQVISRVKSIHCNTAEDRVWKFECKDVGINPLNRHFWTGWINDYDGSMAFNCPFNSVVTGFKSEHNNGHEDRRWKLRCSKKTGMVNSPCHTTNEVNNYDAAMDYVVPPPFYLVGMYGYQHDHYGDRRYRFTLCKVRP